MLLFIKIEWSEDTTVKAEKTIIYLDQFAIEVQVRICRHGKRRRVIPL